MIVQNLEAGRSFCAEPNLKKAKKRVRKAAKKLGLYVRALGSLAARKKLDPTLRETFRAAGEAIVPDMTTLKTSLACPIATEG